MVVVYATYQIGYLVFILVHLPVGVQLIFLLAIGGTGSGFVAHRVRGFFGSLFVMYSSYCTSPTCKVLTFISINILLLPFF